MAGIDIRQAAASPGRAVLLALVLCGTTTAAARDDEREPVPLEFELARAEKEIRELYRREYQATSRPDLRRFAGTLLERAHEETTNLAMCYVLLRESRDVATRSGDPITALDAVNLMGKTFRVDTATMNDEVIQLALRSTREPDEFESLVRACIRLARESFIADGLERSHELLRMARRPASRLSGEGYAARLREFAREVAVAQQDFRKVEEELARAESAADDPEANLTAGRYHCLTKRAWSRGLPLLARGADVALGTLARQELAALDEPDLPVQLSLQLGHSWLEASRSLSGRERETAASRGAAWLAASIPELDGVERDKVLREIESLADVGVPYTLTSIEPGRPSGLVTIDSSARSLAPFHVLSGEWKLAGPQITHNGRESDDDAFLRSLVAASWLRVDLEFRGGNPGLYFSTSGTREGRQGINLDSDARYNGEIERAVDESRWHLVTVLRDADEYAFWLDGERVHEMGALEGSYIVLKAHRGTLRVRRFVALGYNR